MKDIKYTVFWRKKRKKVKIKRLYVLKQEQISASGVGKIKHVKFIVLFIF